jgi:sec-independent protein translocase protein TatA
MLEGWEWLIIGVVAIVIIMWGPAKIPEFARALGRAKGEFSKASKEFNDAATATPNATSASTPAKTAPSTSAQNLRNRDEMLLDTARSLGIATEGKTREQISEEIAAKAKQLGSA